MHVSLVGRRVFARRALGLPVEASRAYGKVLVSRPGRERLFRLVKSDEEDLGVDRFKPEATGLRVASPDKLWQPQSITSISKVVQQTALGHRKRDRRFQRYYEPLGKPGYGRLSTDAERAAYDAVRSKYLFAGVILLCHILFCYAPYSH